MAKKVKIDYDFENDVLYLYAGQKVKDSLGFDNFVLDFSMDDKIIGVEILDASKFFSSITDIKISKKILSEVKSGEIFLSPGREIVYILITLPLKIKEMSNIRITIPAPLAVIV